MRLDSLNPALLGLLQVAMTGHGDAAASKPKNAILLSEVESLTLRASQQTTHRRVPAVPQLKCVSAPAVCALHAVDVMRCVNQGSGYEREDVQWACTASLPTPDLKLGATDVLCEGYDSPDDPYVLKGSCAVEYRLVLTDEGERRHPELGRSGGKGGGMDLSAVLFGAVFVAVLLWMAYSALTQARANRRREPRRRGGGGNGWGGGGGGGGGGWGPGGGGFGGGGWGRGDGDFPDDDPPPPYPGTKPRGGPQRQQQQQRGWQPGFWSGLGAGAAAGYLAGNRGGGGGRQNEQAQGNGQRNYGGTWGSGSRSSSSSGSSSGARHESTGFGSTSRR